MTVSAVSRIETSNSVRFIGSFDCPVQLRKASELVIMDLRSYMASEKEEDGTVLKGDRSSDPPLCFPTPVPQVARWEGWSGTILTYRNFTGGWVLLGKLTRRTDSGRITGYPETMPRRPAKCML